MCIVTKLLLKSAESDNKAAEASIDIANVYRFTGDDDKASEMLQDAIKYAKRFRRKMRLHSVLAKMLGEQQVMAVYNR